ncbi:hypothetical protein C8J57DRAFT_625346 [Mycena rebaudengoi]|nr:hypothetical protein C8J57DRAFT_625346 [Mycena rebaudengoi]
MDIPLLLSSDFCGTPSHIDMPGYTAPKSLLTLRDLLADRALSVKRPRQQPPSLIFSLPPELLSEIFMHATAKDQPITKSLLIPMQFHWTLSHICGLWRAVALHTPSLWSRVVLHLGNRTAGFGHITALAKTCFARSYELPLTLVITSSVFDAESIPNLAMELVLPVRHRIRHLELALPAVFTESVFKLPRNSLKSLRSITVSASMSVTTDFWFRSMSALAGAPLLDTVKFKCCYPSDSLTAWRRDSFVMNPYVADLPWEQLTELRLQELALRCDDAMYVLESATNLRHLSMDIKMVKPLEQTVIAFTNTPAAAPTDTPQRPKHITVPALQVLEVLVSGWPSAPADFFDRLILPSLKGLSIMHKLERELPCATLSALQTRSEFSLEKFLLTSRIGDSLIPFLKSNPQLHSLQLTFCGFELIPFVVALTPTSNSDAPTVLPRLTKLILGDRWVEARHSAQPTETWASASKAVVEMGWSRWHTPENGPIARLETFVFGSQIALNRKRAARLAGCRMKGMVFETPTLLKHPNPTRPDYLVFWEAQPYVV